MHPLVTMRRCLSTLVLAFVAPNASECCSSECRSKSTHIVWRCPSDEENLDTSVRSLTRAVDCGCRSQSRSQAEKECLLFLRENVMPFDKPNMETLGFVSDEDVDVDGLDSGLVGPTVKLALDAKVQYPWTDALPQDIFYEYVLNYANVNEARSNWRPLLHGVVEPMLNESSATTIPEAVRVINTKLWKALARRDDECIVFQSGQTPLIFDPMSVIAFGYASCTGLAILFVNALRAAGIPARLVGTPAWKRRREEGNHNWVEVMAEDGRWYFLEPSPAQETVDTLERDPCERWFCQADRFPGAEVYAARLDRSKADTHYPMAWEWNSTDVPGENRTDYYVEVCSKCK